jgi:transcriptional regulator with XRE-family HTH domain
MITSGQMRASRALLGLDQRQFAELCGVSLPTIQRMEGSDGTVRGMIDTLVKVVEALDRAGVELIGDFAQSTAIGRGVRLKEAAAVSGRLKPVKPSNQSSRTRSNNAA